MEAGQVLYVPGFVHGGYCPDETRKSLSQTVGRTLWAKISLYAVTARQNGIQSSWLSSTKPVLLERGRDEEEEEGGGAEVKRQKTRTKTKTESASQSR